MFFRQGCVGGAVSKLARSVLALISGVAVTVPAVPLTV